MLITLSKKSTDKGLALQKTIAGALLDAAAVISKGPQEELEIRDLDEVTTQDDVQKALKEAAGDGIEILTNAIRVRAAFSRTQTARVTLPVATARKIVGENGKIRIGMIVRELKIDLVLISEPYKQLTGLPWETDITTKAVIWSCDKLPFQSVVNNVSAGFVAAPVDGIRFYSCYAPPSLTIVEFIDFLDRLTKDAKQYYPVAIAGDFNAWAVDWGSKYTNARGKALLEAFTTLDVVLLNSGDMPTYTKGDASSIVDLTFASSSIARKNCDWRVLNIYTASDHNAILWETANHQSPRRSNNQLNTIGSKVKSFDPSALLVSLDSDPIITGPAEDKTKDLLTRLTRACDVSMPRKRDNNQRPSVHWWNDRISTLRAKCLKKRRISQRGYRRPNSAELVAEYKQARRNLNKAIKESKRRCWTELVEEVEKDPWGRPYKVVMTHLKSQPMPSPTCPQLLLKIVAALFPRQRDFMYSSLQLNSEDIPPVTKEELMEASNRVGNNKTPGLDGIPNIALKTSVKAAPALFLDVYNTCLKEGTFPRNSNDWYYYLKVKNHQKSRHPTALCAC
ncbi:putative 115 kDa protein in type-1 retrotransposable element R1DM [Bactrocera oleae]|uniref:putative 115 kDa protein in type-1 retrotransposable element R1DM n=1 Tax=Bactrocera oleae TaxID=104688 RepID=UPI00387ECD7B